MLAISCLHVSSPSANARYLKCWLSRAYTFPRPRRLHLNRSVGFLVHTRFLASSESAFRRKRITFFLCSSLCCSYFKTGFEQELVSERSERGFTSFQWFFAVFFRVLYLFADVLLFQHPCLRGLVVASKEHTLSMVSLCDPTLLFMSRPRRRGEFGVDLRDLNNV